MIIKAAGPGVSPVCGPAAFLEFWGLGDLAAEDEQCVLKKTKTKVEAAEGKFGTVGAIASAFVFRFLPRSAVRIRKSEDNSGRKSKHSLELRTNQVP
ncbi:hypothetical protein M2105_000761 [Paenibacillus sp. PastF-1]|nr:hypothetical protein [Paenibacillus sp. PastF-2]MDF9846732.1 hypothetical protein [Paenibacillus sp. PastM-2]MDF9852919.1 hypothetical protein [Paenibacillus sp. PastF-1]MDH6478576.1 hypothetical protein [Paenibacillus sp. PastH-2]MDH6505926.1 hypothetical protein [Paenibacillus sp. PastM-3]